MIAATALALALAAAPPPPLEKQVLVPAAAEAVWAAWTTSAGAETFFAPKANIVLERGGAYDILFDPSAPAGLRGAEGMHVLAFVPREMLAFEWNAPPKFPEIRNAPAKTFVVVQLTPDGERRTRLVLHHLGWGEGGRWGEVRDYFDHAWDYVLANLVKRFESGPIDWAAAARSRK
jgi:uncharacterized protein YndB with AHSA1/START domain